MAPEVRLSGPENEPLGVVSLMEALRMAGELDVDLVEIAATANPPVCRLMDYGKFKYQEQKRLPKPRPSRRSSRSRKSSSVRVRTMATTTSRCATSAAFLADGDKCKITLRFRGREITHQELGLALLNAFATSWLTPSWLSSFPSWKAAR
jgi:translation initiation factor IF-3